MATQSGGGSDQFGNGEQQTIAVEHDLECVTRDGTILRSDVYHPTSGGRHPTLLCRTPYDKLLGRNVAVAEALAAAGYCVVVQDIRGRLKSDGEFHWMFGPLAATHEAEDGHDAVEWAADLPWSDGRVGTYGHSYDGWTAWRMFAKPPPSLVAAFISGISQTQRAFTFGVFETGRRLEWTYELAAIDPRLTGERVAMTRAEAGRRWQEVERGKYLWYLPLGDLPDGAFGDLAPQLKAYLEAAGDDPWDFASVHPNVAIPVMQMTGWWDRLIGTVDNHVGVVTAGSETVQDQHRLVIGPWGHDPTELTGRLGPVDYGPAADRTYPGLIRRWFDFHMKGVDDGISEEDPIQLFIVGENEWRGYDEWPPPVRELTLHLASGGSANTIHGDGSLSKGPDPRGSESDTFVYDPHDPLMSLMRSDSQALPIDQAPHDDRRDALVYHTPAQERELTLIGAPILYLWAATDGYDTDWMANLAIVDRDGLAVNLTYGLVRAQFRNDPDRPEPLVPGEAYLYRITLNPIGIRLGVGERLRLYVSSSDFPNFDRNHNTGRPFWNDAELRIAYQTVLHSPEHPSRLVLPVAASKQRLGPDAGVSL